MEYTVKKLSLLAGVSKEAHAGLGQMYVARFTAYYDRKQPGLAEFLKEAILIYTGMKG